jgi:hypothetical protein
VSQFEISGRSAQKTYEESGGDNYRDGDESASQALTQIAKIEASKYCQASYCEGGLDKDRSHCFSALVPPAIALSLHLNIDVHPGRFYVLWPLKQTSAFSHLNDHTGKSSAPMPSRSAPMIVATKIEMTN